MKGLERLHFGRKMNRVMPLCLIASIFTVAVLCGCRTKEEKKLPVKLLILPKFEVGELENDYPGEGQYYYEEYLSGGEEYKVRGCDDGNILYYKDGVALSFLGEGKVSSVVNLSGILSDERFDFSDAYILSTGCAGAARDYGILGDVFVITSAVDYDLGHHADIRDMKNGSAVTWFHDDTYDDNAYVFLDETLSNKIYELVKDTPLETTEISKKYLQSTFPGETWANREPAVMKGTSISGDNYWKGEYDHANAVYMTDFYKCPDPFAAAEMEDVAVAQVAESFDMLDRLITLRVAVNMDVYPAGAGPEAIWGEQESENLWSDSSKEALDIFDVAMKNNFEVGKIIAESILNGELSVNQ